MGDEEYVQLLGVTDPKSQSPYWKIGDYLSINAQVVQALPESLECGTAESCSHTKYLSIELKDHLGNTILDPHEAGSYRPLLLDGSTTYSLPSVPFAISLSGVAGSTTLQCQPVATDSIVSTCSSFSFASITDQVTIKADSSRKVTATIGSVAQTCKKLGTTTDCELPASGTTDCTFVYNGNNVTITISGGASTAPITPPASVILKPTGAISGSTTTTTGASCTGEVVWSGNIRVYDNVAAGSLYTISNSIYSYQGTPQVQPFTIRVNCNPTATTSGSGSTTTYGDIVSTAQVKSSGTLTNLSTAPTISGDVTFHITASQDLHSAYYRITKPDGSVLSGLNMQSDGSLKSWKSENSWADPGVPGNYEIEIVVRTSSGPSTAYGHVYTVTR